MNEPLKAIIYQALGYSIAMLLGIGILVFLQRGFLLKFLRVKASLGKLVLIRVRQVNHWDYHVGNWNEQDLIFGGKKGKKRINNIKNEHLYRSLGINWVDLDGKVWAILPPASTEAVGGFDPEKQESLVTRALYAPPMEDLKNKIVLVLIVLAIVMGAASAYFGYNILNQVGILSTDIASLKSLIQAGAVVATS